MANYTLPLLKQLNPSGIPTKPEWEQLLKDGLIDERLLVHAPEAEPKSDSSLAKNLRKFARGN